MTEEEITKMAILKAQADNIPSRVTPEESKPVEIAETPAATIPEEYQYELRLGTNKTINFKLWTGKTKKKIRAIADDEELTNKDIVQILIRDNIFPSDVYLNAIETQYVMLNIRAHSLDDTYLASGYCDICNLQEEMTINILKDIDYKKGDFPQSIDDLDIDLVDIDSEKELHEIFNTYLVSDKYDGITTEADVEIAMHIKKSDYTAINILSWMDELDLKSLKIISEKMQTISPDFNISKKQYCIDCDKGTIFVSTDLPDIFTELLE